MLTTQNLWGQILDDSTKQVYGASTTSFVLEEDIRYQTENIHYLDTLLDGFHQFTPTNVRQNLYQDLGGIGTALRPLYFEPSEQIGTTLGINVYQPYLFTAENVRYFDAKAPMIEAFYVQGFRGDQFIDFTFTRSINSNINFGLQYRRMLSEKQFAAQEAQDLVADQHRLVIHFNYFKKRYKLLYHFSHLNLMAFETGGVKLNSDETIDNIFEFQLEDANLENARSWQTQNNQHIYQEYTLGSGLQLFHIFDWTIQRDDYSDNNPSLATNSNFYQEVFNNSFNLYGFRQDSTSEGIRFQQFENTLGFKGKAGNLFYQAYAKNRILSFNNSYEDLVFESVQSDTTIAGTEQVITDTVTNSVLVNQNLQTTEIFIGGDVQYQFTEDVLLKGKLEYLIGKLDYYLEGGIEIKKFEGGFVSASYSPTILQRQFVSNHVFWENDFENMFVQHFYGKYNFQKNKIRLQPFFSYSLISNYIYYNQEARPTQTAQEVQLIKAGLDLDYSLGKFRTQNKFIYALSSNEDFLRVPNILINSRIFCEDCFLSSFINTQIGFELHYKSSYLADAYMPVTKQFHLQDEFTIPAYLIADFFINMQFNQARIFLKYYHLNSRPNYSYVTTPTYPGMLGTFVFGINWRFFD